jgi:hypothetical protein
MILIGALGCTSNSYARGAKADVKVSAHLTIINTMTKASGNTNLSFNSAGIANTKLTISGNPSSLVRIKFDDEGSNNFRVLADKSSFSLNSKGTRDVYITGSVKAKKNIGSADQYVGSRNMTIIYD